VTELSDSELERYARQIILPDLGGVGQKRLKQAKVVVIGAGGVGSAVIQALAGAGVGLLRVIDDDVVDRSNLHRQPIFRDDQTGQQKAQLGAAFARQLNPDVETEPVQARVSAENAEELVGGIDLVIDGSDNFATRLAVNEAATQLRIPLISAAAVQFQAQVGLFRGWEPDRPCYRCFVGDAFDSDDCDTCAERGVLGPLPGLAGSLAAIMAINWIARIGDDPAGKLYLFDAKALQWRTIRLPKDPGCRTCG
jgi:adenylyltransferase/sulfurtransferase